mgnify:CR=1 FL=1
MIDFKRKNCFFSIGWVEIGLVSREVAEKATGNSEHGRTVQ